MPFCYKTKAIRVFAVREKVDIDIPQGRIRSAPPRERPSRPLPGREFKFANSQSWRISCALFLSQIVLVMDENWMLKWERKLQTGLAQCFFLLVLSWVEMLGSPL
ncbi:uncharacterized protein LOC126598982 [Malus sylvestris]|uniref:uncharacterized protein LOC126598982 n=1 Tax=Malus sylvestris TaxID=3752 RepID=UPI0021AD018A|nr:uncharacterized protein LOC126598982 [Malus sylvestris]